MLHRRSPDHSFLFLLTAGLLGLCLGAGAWAQNVSLKLSTGDRISGEIVSQTTNTLTLSNAWSAELSVPLNYIVSRVTNNLDTPLITGSADMLELRKEGDKKSAKTPLNSSTNHWNGEAQVGMDFLFGATYRQIVYGKLKLDYQRPYHSHPKKLFKNAFEFSADYGIAKATPNSSSNAVVGTISDRLTTRNKTTFDLVNDWYVYNLVGGGYNHLLKIDSQYEAGPGMGYHLFNTTNFNLNVEAGVNYQAHYRSDGNDVQDVYYRFAEDGTWKIAGKLSWNEKLEAFPRVNLTGFRMRFESTLSYELWRNLSLNLTLLDLYDTQPAANVNENELQIRSSIGVKF
jgi:hypothetical protein